MLLKLWDEIIYTFVTSNIYEIYCPMYQYVYDILYLVADEEVFSIELITFSINWFYFSGRYT